MAASPLVLVAGSLHYDVVVAADRLPALDETLPGRAVDYVCGGKGGNQAIAAARHGAATAFAGAVGDDPAGKLLAESLARAGVDVGQLAVRPGSASGMSVAIVTATGEYGAVIVSAANQTIDAAAITLPPGLRVLVLQNEIPEAANAVLAEAARARGVTTILNAAPARPFATDLLDAVDILIVNRVEAAMLSGLPAEDPAQAEAAATALAAAGGTAMRTVVVTLGGAGAVLAEPGAAPRHLPPHKVEIVSTHGAGDAFTGAFAARLAAGEAVPSAVAYAQVAAALNVATAPRDRGAIGPAAVAAALQARRG